MAKISGISTGSIFTYCINYEGSLDIKTSSTYVVVNTISYPLIIHPKCPH